MIKYTNIVQKNIEEQGSSQESTVNKGKSEKESELLNNLFLKKQTKNTSENRTEYSEKLGNLFGVDKPKK
jgi:hypothetical protein